MGLLLGSWLSFLPLTVLVFLIVLAGALSLYEPQIPVSRAHGLILYACVLFGMGYWVFEESGNAAADLVSPTGQREVTLSGIVAAPVEHRPDRVTIIVAVQRVGQDGRSGNLRVTWRAPDTDVFQGDRITVRARLRLPFGMRNPGGFDYGAYLRDRGIHAVATVRGPHRIQVQPPGAFDVGARAWRQIDQWRNQVRQAAVSTLEQPARGLFLGMIVGEQNDIPLPVRDDFMTTGTVHIISISGSHLGLLAFVSFFGVRWMTHRMPSGWLEKLSCVLPPKRLAVLATVPMIVFYTLLSGAHVATVRSLVMLLFYLFAVWIGHDRHIVIALSLAALFTTLSDPKAIYDLSFQFSYISVLAIALALWWWGGRDREENGASQSMMAAFTNWRKQYMVMTLAATLAALPLVAYYFNQVAWLGIFTNAIVVPLVGLFVVPLGLGASLVVLLGGLDQLPLSGLQQAIMHGLASFVEMVADVPGARWHVASPSLLAIAGFYLCLMFALFSRKRVLRWMSVSVLTLCLFWWAWSPRHVFDDDALRITFLDVRQGDATVLELPGGQTVLVDGGVGYGRWDMGRMVVGPYLWDRGIRRLDHVIATHPQLDHVGGLPWIIGNFEVGHYWSNGVRRVKPFYQRLENAVKEKGLVERIAWEGEEIINDGTCRLTSLNPPASEHGLVGQSSGHLSGTELNNLSVVLSVTCGQQTILLTADAEVDALTRLVGHPLVQAATVVKIPHHGAKSSLNRGWIERLRATSAVVSAGRGNRYGHPDGAVLRAYRQRHIAMYRTDSDGAIVVSVNPDSGAYRIQRTSDRTLVPLTLHPYSFEREWGNVSRLWEQWVRNI